MKSMGAWEHGSMDDGLAGEDWASPSHCPCRRLLLGRSLITCIASLLPGSLSWSLFPPSSSRSFHLALSRPSSCPDRLGIHFYGRRHLSLSSRLILCRSIRTFTHPSRDHIDCTYAAYLAGKTSQARTLHHHYVDRSLPTATNHKTLQNTEAQHPNLDPRRPLPCLLCRSTGSSADFPFHSSQEGYTRSLPPTAP